MAEVPTEELPPHTRIFFPVNWGFSVGRGALSWTKSALEAVLIEIGRTTALANGRESGTAATKISRQVVYSWNAELDAFPDTKPSQ
jgi:hypothetical protein